MSRRGTIPFVRTLRRAATYGRLYGLGHRLTLEACDEAAKAGSLLAGDGAEVLIVVTDDTLFVDGVAEGEASLQHHGFIRALEEAGVSSVVLRGTIASDDVLALVGLLVEGSGAISAGSTVDVNTVDVTTTTLRTTPGAGLRRTYARSLDMLRGVGTALRGDQPLSLDATASAVRDLLATGMQTPHAALLLATVKSHHDYTFYHSVNTAILSLALARLVGLPDEDTVLLGVGAMLHDIGKIGVSSAILGHPGRLDEDQWVEVRRHPRTGAEAILEASRPGQEVAAAVALEHHARFDGSGYPRLVYHDGAHDHAPSGHPLHYFSRLVAVADTYDALTTRRSYRRAEAPDKALEIIAAEAGTSYDPDFVEAFSVLLGIHPPGSFLRLDSGEVAMAIGGGAGDGICVVVVRDRLGGVVAHPEPITCRPSDVVEQVPASVVGTTPTAVLDRLPADPIGMP
ncbi:MAG: HD-GYP domain-containing protein [Acidimicrobiia bacterium]|nr:HD-GYP domain-containing protein [Acidimicrobiia bacterium]